jgi:hypothetical protein
MERAWMSKLSRSAIIVSCNVRACVCASVACERANSLHD